MWSLYRHTLLEPIAKNPHGLTLRTLRKQCKLSNSQFYKVVSILEQKRLIERKRLDGHITYVAPTKLLVWCCENSIKSQFELTIMDFDDVLTGRTKEKEVIAELDKRLAELKL